MPSFAMGKELAGLGGLFNRFVTAPLTGAALFNQGRSGSALNQGLQSIPSTRETDAGRVLGNVLGNEMRYMGSQLQRGSLPYLGNEMRYATNELSQGRNPYGEPLNGIQTRNYGPGYKEKELAAGAAAERFRPGAGFPGQQGAADLAYKQELSRISQLTAQDPELQRYEQRRKAAKTQEEMNAVRDIGMEIWAKKYGGEKGLASRVKPGQVGYDVIQKTLYPQGSPLPPLPEDSLAMLNAIAPTNAQGIRENVTPTLGQMPVFGDASEAMYQAVTNGGTLVTPMPSPQSKTTQQETAQLLADTYKSSFLGDDEFAKRLRAMDPYMQ